MHQNCSIGVKLFIEIIDVIYIFGKFDVCFPFFWNLELQYSFLKLSFYSHLMNVFVDL